jgi:uncharacterized protein YyaL (SSP411 family)
MAYLDDYAFMLDALLELLQTHFRAEDLKFAVELAEVLLENFSDPDAGGFYFTAQDHEQLRHRSKGFADDAVPSGNGVAAQSLCRLGYLLGVPRYLEPVESTLKTVWEPLQQYPLAHMSLLDALEEYLHPGEIIIIRGATEEARAWSAELAKIYAPKRMIFAIPSDLEGLPSGLEEKKPQARTVAYRCQGQTCSLPLESLQEVVKSLKLNLA